MNVSSVQLAAGRERNDPGGCNIALVDRTRLDDMSSLHAQDEIASEKGGIMMEVDVLCGECDNQAGLTALKLRKPLPGG